MGGGTDRSLGLNILTGSGQTKHSERFLKQRLFDVGRLSDTSRFLPDRRKMERGNPDGVEDSETSEEKREGLSEDQRRVLSF